MNCNANHPCTKARKSYSVPRKLVERCQRMPISISTVKCSDIHDILFGKISVHWSGRLLCKGPQTGSAQTILKKGSAMSKSRNTGSIAPGLWIILSWKQLLLTSSLGKVKFHVVDFSCVLSVSLSLRVLYPLTFLRKRMKKRDAACLPTHSQLIGEDNLVWGCLGRFWAIPWVLFRSLWSVAELTLQSSSWRLSREHRYWKRLKRIVCIVCVVFPDRMLNKVGCHFMLWMRHDTAGNNE